MFFMCGFLQKQEHKFAKWVAIFMCKSPIIIQFSSPKMILLTLYHMARFFLRLGTWDKIQYLNLEVVYFYFTKEHDTFLHTVTAFQQFFQKSRGRNASSTTADLDSSPRNTVFGCFSRQPQLSQTGPQSDIYLPI